MRYEDRLPEIEDLEDRLELAILMLEEEHRREYRPRKRHKKHHHRYAHKVRLIVLSFINNSIYKLMDTTFAANQQQDFQPGLEDIDNSGTLVTGSFSNGSVVSDNEGVATGSMDANGKITFVAKGEGIANLFVKATVSYTNSLGKKVTEDKQSDPVGVTVTKTITADGVKLVLTAGAITDQPTADTGTPAAGDGSTQG